MALFRGGCLWGGGSDVPDGLAGRGPGPQRRPAGQRSGPGLSGDGLPGPGPAGESSRVAPGHGGGGRSAPGRGLCRGLLEAPGLLRPPHLGKQGGRRGAFGLSGPWAASGGAPGRDADGGNLPGLRRGGADSDPGLPGAGLGLPGALGDHWTRARMSSRASSGWRALFRAKATVLAAFSMTVSTSRGVTIMGSGEVSRG